MKTLSTIAAAAALGVDRKTIDNILAREARSLVSPGRRGRSRRIPVEVLERIAVAMILGRDLGVGIAKGLELADRLRQSPAHSISIGSLTTLTFDVEVLRAALEDSIDEALESVAEPARGRSRS